MVEKIISFCGKNRFLVFICVGFGLVWGIWAILKTPLDALPDISDTQVIIFTEWSGRSPDLVEDQITYPLITAFLAAPKVKVVRGFTMFGLSFVFVLFEDGTDIYWARSRVLEYLSNLQGQLPKGVTPQLGPDATGVGWIYEYALVDESGKMDLQELRSFQDWYLKYWLSSVPGVAEVASVGGFVKEYQVEIDPVKLQAYNLSLPKIKTAIRKSNNDVGGRVIELAQHEYAVRGRGYITDKHMLEQVVVATDEKGTPVLIKDIARVQIGGNIRRGLTELNGEGEVVGGIVVMRYGENALTVIDRVKEKLAKMKPAFPKGVKVIPTYDRSSLILDSIDTLSWALAEEVFLVSLIILLFLFNFWSVFISIIALIVAVVFSFIPMYYMNLTTNIMSLAGIIIAIGDVVDAAVVMTENAHRKLEDSDGSSSRAELIIQAAMEIGPNVFASLLVTVVAFIPVFLLQAQEGRLFSPLAYTKTFSVAFGALLGITLVPALMTVFIRGRIYPILKNPINRWCIKIYRAVLIKCLQYRYKIITGVLILAVLTIPVFMQLGSEFMPPLDEQTLFFMPVTTPGISIETARELLQTQDKILKSFPEVKLVFGKAGRAETSTDPAPLSMFETIVHFHPRSKWRPGMTKKKLLVEMEKALKFPGVHNAFTMPIKARFDMLTTGIRTPVGIKVFGDDLEKIDAIGQELEQIIRQVPGTRSVYAEREMGGFFIDFIPDRDAIARYGLLLEDVLDIVETSIGGLDIDTTIEGRERYKINIRYPRELRDSIEALKQVLVPIQQEKASLVSRTKQDKTVSGRVEHIPLGLLGKVEATMGPSMIKDEMGSLTGWIYIDTAVEDIGGFVQSVKLAIEQKKIELPPGYFLKWTGQYEYLERMQQLMLWAIPLTILLIAIILFLNFRSLIQTSIVMLSVPFSAIGAIWLLFLLGYNTSVAVWVGIIALLGIGAQTASLMMVYLNEGFSLWSKEGRMNSIKDLLEMVTEHCSMRVRPLLMAVGLNIIGLFPIIFSSGVGSDVARSITAPLWGGLITLTLLTLIVIPAVYVAWKEFIFWHKKKYE